MKRNSPEILAPAGDFNSAIHALNSGADAVYLGLTSFSARKKAKNFTLDDLRRLKTYCYENRKKIYVAINTILKDCELEELFPLLQELEEIEIDALIIQDLGLAKLIKESTSLPIHASTQLATHNIHGIKMLKKLGFSRAVLSRELSLKEITNIKKQFPEMELEIFIHGALCYGFSGLCLASSKMIGRSANRGECGQICRTWFNDDGKKEYCFSLNDLSLEKKILKLKEIGVESLKIEGRMKGPGYTSSTSKLYHNILNGLDYKQQLKESQIEFNRSGHDAYLKVPKGQNNINKDYPSHMGQIVGKIISQNSNSFIAQINDDLENRDGLMVLDRSTPSNPIKFAANIEEKKGNNYKFRAKLPKNFEPTLYKVSSHNMHLKEEKPQKYKPWKSKVKLKITITPNSIEISTGADNYTYPITLEEAKNPIDLNKTFHKSFYAGGETKYKFPVEVINNSNLESPFIPGSKLKEIRNSFQSDYITSRPEETLISKKNTIPMKHYIKNRATLPFIPNFDNIKLEELEVMDNRILLPLSPMVFDSEKYLSELQRFLENNKDKKFTIGLNNLSHISFIDELPTTLDYYCDYGLYTLNNYSINHLEELIPNLKWVTKWVEEEKTEKYPPIFVSRTCFKAQKGGCPPNCSKKYEFKISQKRNQKVIVRDCISYTFTESKD